MLGVCGWSQQSKPKHFYKMYCDRCNVEFTEGLRYCKWCGQVLADRPRVTSELHACPNCAAAVQPGWIFCKSCGVRLAAPVSDPGRIFCPKCGTGAEATAASCASCGTGLAEPAKSSHETPSTSVIGDCPSCGERLDTGSMYCKACGAAVYAQARPFGGSAMLCAACNSYSPIGSVACRVCGAPLGGEAEGVTAAVAHPKPSTLPDLAEHLTSPETQIEDDPHQVNSGANTAMFSPTGKGSDATSTLAVGDRGTGLVGEQRVEGPSTNTLPGLAGSKSEMPSRTTRAPKTRITSSVEDEIPDRRTSVEVPALASETVPINSPAAQSAAQSSDEPRNVGASLPRMSAGPSQTREQGSTIPFAQGEPAVAPRSTSDYGAPASEPLAQPQPQPKNRSAVATASVVVGLIVLAAAAYLIYSFVGKGGAAQHTPAPRVETKATETPAPPPPPAAPVVPAGMVSVQAGSYTIGREDGDPVEAPVHAVKLGAFYIDRNEVTNAQYAKFVEATKHKPPANWKGTTLPAGRDDFPVTGVSWQDAVDYATWAGKRLPTEAEWEAAARGSDARKYPWGNEWQSGLANIGVRSPEKVEASKYPSGITEVGKYPQGASASGALDMIGNVWEWVADEIAPYPGSNATLPVPAESPAPMLRVIRGGAYDGDRKHDASYRGFLDGSLPYPKVGFRCAKSAGQ
ncbi:MAG TPA: SUMF1/EgtB/PvdO family nonheme iron enzyme [Blastocatellia bacterium]|nr:SUMF1/EgtB/PvdO family nonheme iron enzyme [Blastocatellia bacterium]